MKGKFDVKKLWKRNQIMITALALMIAIAGYLNFTGKQIDDEILFTTSAQFEEADASVVEDTVPDAQAVHSENAGLYDISAEDDEYYTEIESLDEDIVLSSEGDMDEEMAEASVETGAEAAGVEMENTEAASADTNDLETAQTESGETDAT